MDTEKLKRIFKSFSKTMEKPADSKYPILIYLIYIYAFSLPLVLILSYFNPCFLNLAIPAVAVLIPYKLLKEKSLKKILITGIIAILLLNLTFSVYQVEGVYFSQQPGDLSSDALSEGTVDKVYGEQKSRFNFTVNLNKDQIQSQNYSVFLNITWMTASQEGNENRPFEMDRSRNISQNLIEYYYIFNLEENEMGDRLYEHHFSVRKNTTTGVEWEETDASFGPFTISRLDAYRIIMTQQVVSTMIFFFLIMGLVWWRRRMKRSRESSTAGLEEKEKSLDDYCPKCGNLLEGETVCPECGTDVEALMIEEEKEKTKKAIEDVELFEEEEESENESPEQSSADKSLEQSSADEE